MPLVVGLTSALLAFDILGSAVSFLLDIFCSIEESSGELLDYFSIGDLNKHVLRLKPRPRDRSSKSQFASY